MSWIDSTIVFAFIAYAIHAGLKSRGVASENLDEYFLAGRSLPGWKAGISMAATQFAADTPLIVTGMIAMSGIFSMWRYWGYTVSFLLLAFVLAPSWRQTRVITDAELTEIRYGRRSAAALRGIKAIYLGTIVNCMVLAQVLLAATRIAEPFMLWNQWLPAPVFDPVVSLVHAIGSPLTVVSNPGDPSTWPPDVWIVSANNLLSIVAIVGVTAFYSTTGGLRSVVDTDVVQFAIMMIATAIFAWYVTDKAGGLLNIPDKLREAFPGGGPGGISIDQMLAFTPSVAKDATLAVLSVFAIQWIAQTNSDGTGYLAQRTMACRSDRDAKAASVVFTVAQIVCRSLLWIPLALGLLLLFPPASPADAVIAKREITYVLGIELLPAGFLGLLLTAMFAALASTVDTHLNWGASYWTNDIYKRFVCESWLKKQPSPRSLVWVARGANLLVLLIALIVMTQLSSIRRAWELQLVLGAGIGGILVLRWLWWRVTAWGELASIIASTLLAPVLLLGITATDDGVQFFGLLESATTTPSVSTMAWRFLLMAVLSTLAGVLVSLLTREDMDRLAAFYRHTRPPGFWGPVAIAAGQNDPRADHRRLYRGLAAVAGGSLSVLCILTSIGSAISDSPPPVWFPWQSAWAIVLFATGVLLIPVWWRLGFGEDR